MTDPWKRVKSRENTEDMGSYLDPLVDCGRLPVCQEIDLISNMTSTCLHHTESWHWPWDTVNGEQIVWKESQCIIAVISDII